MTQIDPLTLKGILNGDIAPADHAVELVDTVMECRRKMSEQQGRIAELEARPWRSPDDWPYNGQEVEVILNATFTEPDENTWLPWRLDSFDMAQDSGDAIVSWRPRYE